MKRLLKILAASILLCAVSSQAEQVGFIEIHGAIGPATASYVSRAVDLAAKGNCECLIVQLNTPGGLVTSTQDIVERFYSSKVPIVVYVAPAGVASATSAGTFITMAADIAAMAPNTRIGAAHPVSIGFGGGGEGTNSVMGTKAQNDLASFVRNIAEKRSRNADWAETAVRESASITSEKALEMNVIDLIAKDLSDLVHQIDGHEINNKTLKTSGAEVIAIPMSLREKALGMLRPEVMFILMLVAIYGIIAELNNPGAILPGVAGAIALILVLYMSAVLPVNIAGIALILLAIALFVIDVYATSHGVLTVGGVIAFFLGALMLFDRSEPAFRLSLGLIIPATLVTAAFFLFVIGAGLRAQRLPVRAGKETLLGKTAPVLKRIDARGGKVFVEGEYWNATSEVPIEEGQLAEIVGVEGLNLKVKPVVG